LVQAGLLTVGDVYNGLVNSAELAGLERAEAEAVVNWAIEHPSTIQLGADVRA
jgi:hypothetical protein